MDIFDLKVDVITYFSQVYNQNVCVIYAKNGKYFDQVNRIVQIALPFIALYAPAGQILSLASGTSRVTTCLFALKNAHEQQNISYALLQTTIAVASLACAIFTPPLALLIDTSEELTIDVMQLMEALKNRQYAEVGYLSLNILNNSHYLYLFFTEDSRFIIESLYLQMILTVYRTVLAFKDPENQNYLEACAISLMFIIEGSQLILEVDQTLSEFKGQKYLESRRHLLVDNIRTLINATL